MNARIREIAGVFLKLGVTSFGGPIAHLGYFHDEVVTRRQWLDEAEYADLVALCQFLPGPASSQVAFALGLKRGGILGAFTASVFFTAPSAILMIAFAYGIAGMTDLRAVGWLHGLKLAAVAVVAQAVWTMAGRLCPDVPRVAIAVTAAVALTLFPFSTAQIAVIAAGALVGAAVFRGGTEHEGVPASSANPSHRTALACLCTWGALLAVLPMLAQVTGDPRVRLFDSFYRAGALVFGGGHVVLPLLRAELVPTGWISTDQFLAGYGFAQAVPGPLFTFAAYLGTVIHGAPHAWTGGVLGLLAIFLPAWLLVGGALPFWSRLRARPTANGLMRGANAAVVGVLIAALYNPIWKEAVMGVADIVAVIAAFVCLQLWRTPPWIIVIAFALYGAAGL